MRASQTRFYVFQPSKIWEAGNPVDPQKDKKKIKAKTEAHARRQLPDISLGRVWVLIDTIEKETV